MSKFLSGTEKGKCSAAKRAAVLVKSGMKVGLGTGSTATWLVRHLASMVREEGLNIEAVATSLQTAKLATDLGIKIKSLAELGWLDLTIDGADEIDTSFNLIKGGGGALLREKIVASASEKMVVIADSSKLVRQLGKFMLPVEVIPFGLKSSRKLIEQALKDLGYQDSSMIVRETNGGFFLTDERNYILDLNLGKILNASKLSTTLNSIPGVVENGLFINFFPLVIIGHDDGNSEIQDLGNDKNINSPKINFANSRSHVKD